MRTQRSVPKRYPKKWSEAPLRSVDRELENALRENALRVDLKRRADRMLESCVGCSAPVMAAGLPVCSTCNDLLSKTSRERMMAAFRPRRPMVHEVQQSVYEELLKKLS